MHQPVSHANSLSALTRRLDNNLISSLGSDAFKGTPEIEQLFLSENHLVEIPEHVLEFPNLFYLLSTPRLICV